jgi:hypothetical protein
MLIAIQRSAEDLAVELALFLADRAPAALARALIEECTRVGVPLARNLAATALELCRVARIDPGEVRAELELRAAEKDRSARELVDAWPRRTRSR